MFIEMKKQEIIQTSFEKEKSLLTKNRYFGKLTVNRLAINIWTHNKNWQMNGNQINSTHNVGLIILSTAVHKYCIVE